ncbi:MAG: serine hydrolase domain-containing protein [bacterium]
MKITKLLATPTAIALALLAVAAVGHAQTSVPVGRVPNEKFSDVRSVIGDAIADMTIPSAAVGVAQGGKIVWLEGFGWADGPARRRTTAHTPYPIAYITKPLTATAVMMLAERGEIDLDSPVEHYMIPLEFKSYGGESRDVTIRHLLNHTSGLPMHFNYFYEDEGYDPPGIEETVERYGILLHPPGEVFQYANLGYGILGHIISEVTGRPFDEFMLEEVMAPLGMVTSWVGLNPEYARLAAVKYDLDMESIPGIRTDTPGAAEGFSTAYDLLRFGMLHLKNKMPGSPQLLSHAAIDAMHTQTDAGAQYPSDDLYGLGWFFKENDNGYRTVWHEGGIGGARCILKLVPAEGIAVVVLLNVYNDEFPPGRIADMILGTLLPEYGGNPEGGAAPSQSGFSEYEAAPEFTGTWRGEIKTYEGGVPVYMVFQEDGDIHFLKPLDVDRTWVLQNQYLFDRVLNNTGIAGNRIYGWVDARVPTGDAMRRPHVAVLDIVRDGDRLAGSLTAISAAERMYYGLSYYISLEKQD